MGSARYLVAIAATMLLTVESTAYAQFVTFSDVQDAVAGRFFDPATSMPDPSNPNRLVIGLHTGIDWTTWKATDFRASTAAYSYGTAMDTLSFRVHAPNGYYVSKITYAQGGTGSVVRTGKAAGATTWVVNDQPSDMGVFSTNPTRSATVDLTGANLTSVPVSITTSLFAFSTPSLGSATVSVTRAEVLVELLPLP